MAKAAKHADLDKDVQSLMELQDKLNMHAGLHQMVAQQLQRAKLAQRRTDLTLQEISKLESSVPTYKQVGKAYLMQPVQEVVEDLRTDLKSAEDEVKRLTQQQQHAAKTLAATEVEIKELFAASPELGRQLAAASSS